MIFGIQALMQALKAFAGQKIACARQITARFGSRIHKTRRDAPAETIKGALRKRLQLPYFDSDVNEAIYVALRAFKCIENCLFMSCCIHSKSTQTEPRSADRTQFSIQRMPSNPASMSGYICSAKAFSSPRFFASIAMANLRQIFAHASDRPS